MLSYSLNSLRLTNLKFKDTKSARSSQVVRFQMNQEETQRILDGCKAKGIKLCGALVATGLMAADKCSKHHQKKKYGEIITPSSPTSTPSNEEKTCGSLPRKPTRPLQALRTRTNTSQT
ncbi:unnamed protein product [Prunus armeniaca]|uniref:Uncharacterized protein n=1 Tax=Prunus armeniaca TaxID=36596 RepID=A0A6J5VI05_PRUAR|nr:unnamed protein product [Prunus armeniaca]